MLDGSSPSSRTPFAIGPFLFMPVLHYRAEFADAVRLAIREVRPDAIAVEWPDTLESYLRAAVSRLPRHSVILYQTADGQTVYWPVEPADPIVEAARSALEHNIHLRAIDSDIDYTERHTESFPDSYALFRLGYDNYCSAALTDRTTHQAADGDELRELGMAFRLQQLRSQYQRILVVCGLDHFLPITSLLDQHIPTPLARPSRAGIQMFHTHPDSLVEVMAEFPFLSAVYETRRRRLPAAADSAPCIRRKTIADHIFAVIDGNNHKDEWCQTAVNWTARRCHRTSTPDDENGADLLSEPTDETAAAAMAMNRQLVQWSALRFAIQKFEAETGEEIKHWQRRVLAKFSRNSAIIEGRLLPDLYQLVSAARGAVDDTFAYHLLELAKYYPWQTEAAELPTLAIHGEEMWLGTRRIRLRRRIPGRARRVIKLKGRPQERFPGEWLSAIDNDYLCSYPPEDLIIEDYSLYLRKKGHSVLTEEQSRSEPFQNSLLDGIDIRETVRHWPERQIYVRQKGRIKGSVGSVVVIFDPDPHDQRYPFRMTWLGEHYQESDMAFYATPPNEHLVGPGIFRCEYGGFMMSYPPLRLADVWGDPAYNTARDKTERLLMAAIDYSEDRIIAYIANQPPRYEMKTFAARRAKHVLYIPQGQLSPISLKRIRQFHVLAGHNKREIAKDYIF